MIERTKQDRINLIKSIVKNCSSQRGIQIKQLLIKLAEEFKRNPRQSNFSTRLSNGYLTAIELLEILDYLDFEIEIKDISKEINLPRKYH